MVLTFIKRFAGKATNPWRTRFCTSLPTAWQKCALTNFFTKFLHKMQKFREKIIEYHAAAGELAIHFNQTSGLQAHRVNPVNHRSYAVGVWTTNNTT